MSLIGANLEAFLAVYRNKTVLAASKTLGLGQTGVTQRIKALETELGVSLFLRSRKGMALTPDGETLLKHCLLVEESEGKILADLQGRGTTSEVSLKIAGPTSFISGRVISQCASVFKEWPKLNLHFKIDDTEDRTSLLKSGEADIVALYPHQVVPEFDSKLVKPDEYILLGHPSWKGRELREILEQERLFAFHETDNTSLNYLKTFNLLKYLKRPRLYVNENHALGKLLMEGVGFGILLKEIAAPLIQEKKVVVLNDERVMKDPLALAWYPRSQMPPYLKSLLSLIK